MSETTGFNLEQRLSACNQAYLTDYLRAYIRLQFDYGLRISDMLRIDCNSINSDLSIIVNQSKGSNRLIIYPRSDIHIWQAIKKYGIRPMQYYSRYSMYRLYKKIGLSLPSEQNVNNSVTHSARKIKARQIYNDTQSVEVTAQTLGHRSRNSTMYYLSADQKKLELKNGILNNPVGSYQGIKVNKNGVIRFVTDI